MSYVSGSSNQAAAASVTVTAPAGIVDGDILIAHCASYRSTDAALQMTAYWKGLASRLCDAVMK